MNFIEKKTTLKGIDQKNEHLFLGNDCIYKYVLHILLLSPNFDFYGVLKLTSRTNCATLG